MAEAEIDHEELQPRVPRPAHTSDAHVDDEFCRPAGERHTQDDDKNPDTSSPAEARIAKMSNPARTDIGDWAASTERRRMPHRSLSWSDDRAVSDQLRGDQTGRAHNLADTHGRQIGVDLSR